MSLRESVRNGLGFLKRAVGYRSLSTAALIQRNLPYIVAPLRPEGGRIAIDALGLRLDPKRHAHYLPQLEGVQGLVRPGGGRFIEDPQGDPEYQIADLRITPQNSDDLHVLVETFGKRLYEFEDGREWFVLDVGMNVGYASLFFAGLLGWEVIAYEPFLSTYELALANLTRNGLEGRVRSRNAGLAEKGGKVEIAFNAESRSTNGLFGNLHAARKGEDTRVEIDLIDAAEAVEEALAIADHRPLLLKLDCEGAEYGILERLVECGLLSRIEGLLIEFHFILPEHTAERIRKPLRDHGFFLKTLWTGADAEGLLAIRLRR